MRINDIVYFSPSLKLENLDLKDKELVLSHFSERVTEYYLKPVHILVDQKMAFAAGALECLLIDAFSRYSSSEDKVGERIKFWCKTYLKVSETTAAAFYDFFRCGLLHEAHIKNSGEFCFDENYISQSLINQKDIVIVNPKYLLISLETFLEKFMNDLTIDSKLYNIFHTKLTKDFSEEIEKAKS